MTDLAPLHHHADIQPGSAAASCGMDPQPITNGLHHSPPAETNSEEIRCFCGFNDDDGSTVFCELCATWQHVQCYYPNSDVPEIHECNNCKPRPLDERSASERQRQLRLGPAINGKQKRPPGKSHKKKIKDNNVFAVQTNGFAVPDQTDHDRKSGSPRDLPPPAKRPKTSHRPSSSTSALNHPSLPPNHKRAGSVTITGQSPTKSPRSPTTNGHITDYYSPEFMRLQQNPNFKQSRGNVHLSIEVTNDLETWLSDVDELKQVTGGLTQQSVFHRWDRPIEELEATSPGYSLHRERDISIKVHGEHPVKQWLTADHACNANTFLGDIKGLIGYCEDYQQDKNNRWETLTHPEPFVFFHDKLPVYIDCRTEGTSLRYLRRSCRPNVKMQIIIHGTDFHFCMISLTEIADGEELTIPWHIRGRELDIIKTLNDGNPISHENEAHMSKWVTTVLSNFGGCACAGTGGTCSLDRFDLRPNPQQPNTNGHTLKPVKGRKIKTHISPLSTGRATNSRATSEAIVHGDVDEDMGDNRSVSNSSRSKPSSRDITPMGNMSDGAAGLGVEMSDRERRKIQQQERLFEKMEQDESGNRKKRNSAGSALNTPSLTTSKQLGFPDSQNQSPTSVASASKPRINGHSTTVSRANTIINGTILASRSRPMYTDTAVQTEPAKEEVPSALTKRRQAQGSYAQRLLRRVREESCRRNGRSLSVLSPGQSPVATPTKVELGGSPKAAAMPPPPLPSAISHEVQMATQTSPIVDTKTFDPPVEVSDDVEMKDADETPHSPAPTPTIEKKDSLAHPPSSPLVEKLHQPAHPPIQPPAPPWPIDAPTPPIKSPSSPRTTPLHVQLPPVPTFFTASQTPTTPSAAATPDLSFTGNLIRESPPSLSIMPPLLSPSVQASVAPSPMKKKMSLSDYMNRNKKNVALVQAQAQHNSSPDAERTSGGAGSNHASSSPVEGHSMETPSLNTSTSSAVEDADIPLPPISDAGAVEAATVVSGVS
ncbi:hypothetical protein EJ08DRAFT_696856 [Tothia fuscella]|uniref:SET domain-containing protein n=1 Tax=Tothia fuscella TaxID=1048955 RepID=A0A9P4NT48_9PEZI|nr:hypothetical protein EJ08DRAFT_696856 [Tothia fuscella]